MVQLLLVAHAPLASALAQVARHTYPGCSAQLQTLDIPPDWDLQVAEAAIRALLPADQPVLLLVDTAGATPCNAAQAALAGRHDAALVHGVNVPMLWRSLCYGNLGLAELAQRAVEGGLRGVGQAPGGA